MSSTYTTHVSPVHPGSPSEHKRSECSRASGTDAKPNGRPGPITSSERLDAHAARPARVRARVLALPCGSETQMRRGKRRAFFFPAPAAGPRCASLYTLPGGARSPRRSAPCPHCPGPRYPRAPCGTTLSGTGFILVPGCIPWAAVPSRGPRYPREAVPLRNLRLPGLGRLPVQAPPIVRVPSHPHHGLAWVSPAVGCTHGGGAVGAPRHLDLAGAVDVGRGALINCSSRPHDTLASA